MKKFVVGLCCGIAISFTSIAVASDSIKALLFPVHFEINDAQTTLDKDYKVLNVDGHAYVPIRFVAEHLGATIDYDQELQKIYVKNRQLLLTDPDFKDILVGNLILTKAGTNTKVSGQLKYEGVGSSLNQIDATLSFFNDNSRKIGEVKIGGNGFGVDTQNFVTEGIGDFRNYAAVNLRVDKVNGKEIAPAPSMVYRNDTYHFTLNLPKSWDGKYEAAISKASGSLVGNINFIDKANKSVGGGVIFSISVWTKADWLTNGPDAMGIGYMHKIGEQGDKVFTISTPGDVQYDPSDSKLTEEYLAMSAYVNTIRTSFKLTN
ncbi:stalk domain-containing protein [Paenibacillus sp. KN14-4R]|uniref:stalk domain-containing protein n=1 Tax=Paenibacillus sp. KN14-4R TaxID=3445773 RepID=UPI003F9FB94B